MYNFLMSANINTLMKNYVPVHHSAAPPAPRTHGGIAPCLDFTNSHAYLNLGDAPLRNVFNFLKVTICAVRTSKFLFPSTSLEPSIDLRRLNYSFSDCSG